MSKSGVRSLSGGEKSNRRTSAKKASPLRPAHLVDAIGKLTQHREIPADLTVQELCQQIRLVVLQPADQRAKLHCVIFLPLR
ncbi:MAG: hypothetical protein IPK17_35355 [Chloroflexi bacterium]|uniref:hypothetical protein n=1 Tax=Candidatus Flexifilum breve TaxID=3140694 RepID=UPI003134E396|nr:hypothetical protein [Chloroflexota bacterium]